MTKLVQIVSRHEETARDENGKKLDEPTQNGAKRSLLEGLNLKKLYPGFNLSAFHSDKQRTLIATQIFVIGFEELDLPPEFPSSLKLSDYKEQLNSFLHGLDPAHVDEIRNMSDSIKYVFNNPNNHAYLQELAVRLATHVVYNVENFNRSNDQIDYNSSHSPVVDSTYLMLKAMPINHETWKTTGKMMEGEGFQITTLDSGLVLLERRTLDEKYSLTRTSDQEEVKIKELKERVMDYAR
jgi:hypothetical protein